MSSVTFPVDAKKAEQLANAARARGVTVEDLLQQITDDFLTKLDEFEVTSKYVLAKNAELYRRLAK